MAEILKLKETLSKLNLPLVEEAIVMASFHFEVPTFFGKPTAASTLQSAKVLPGLASYAKWDVGDGDWGMRYDIREKVQSFYRTWQDNAESNLGPDAMIVAQSMMNTAKAFVEQVCGWITQFFTDSKNKGANDAETWKHISHTVCEVCKILQDVRRAGRGHQTNDAERATGAFWGQVQAHQEMVQFTQRSLVADPRLSHILNLHLQDNAVMQSELTKAYDVIKGMQRDITELKKKKPAATPNQPCATNTRSAND